MNPKHHEAQEQGQLAAVEEPAPERGRGAPDADVRVDHLRYAVEVDERPDEGRDLLREVVVLQDRLRVEAHLHDRGKEAEEEQHSPSNGVDEGDEDQGRPSAQRLQHPGGGLLRFGLLLPLLGALGQLGQLDEERGDHGGDAEDVVAHEADVEDLQGLDQRGAVQRAEEVVQQREGEHVRRRPLGDHLHEDDHVPGGPDAPGVRVAPPEGPQAEEDKLQSGNHEGEDGDEDGTPVRARVPQELHEAARGLADRARVAFHLGEHQALRQHVDREDAEGGSHLDRGQRCRVVPHQQRDAEAEVLGEEAGDQHQVAGDDHGRNPVALAQVAAEDRDEGNGRDKADGHAVHEQLRVCLEELDGLGVGVLEEVRALEDAHPAGAVVASAHLRPRSLTAEERGESRMFWPMRLAVAPSRHS
mmetsp:Transcript_129941/g.404175  ORF Transcript_129941/g.404175 Transcript_129941/m.404175 type:complete len:415 (-) Transcript_129941:147-1391(-)